MGKKVLAFDFGASSGRAVVFELQNGKLLAEEVHRFDNDPVMVRGSYHWDILRLFHEIKQGILKCKNGGHEIQAVGIDTWGVDYGLLDRDGRLVQNPYHYRDTRTDAVQLDEEQKKAVFASTGIQYTFFNTLFQYMCAVKEPVFSCAETALFIPDLFNYFLTGEKRTEYTIASTSQMLNARTRTFDDSLFDSFGLENKFAPMVQPGSIVGRLSDEICEELGVPSVPVIAVASHDTASAVVAAPMDAPEKSLYISCGTWLLLGAETKEAIINEKSYGFNYTNEGGVFGTYRFLHNIMGLWIQQESRRALKRSGVEVSYQQMEDEAAVSQPFQCIINPNDSAFERPGDMVARIRKFARETGQEEPQTVGEINRTIMESLALECAKSVKEIVQMLPHTPDTIYMVGGGIKNDILCQYVANATGMCVKAGPVEATSIGNALMQYVALGEIGSLQQARGVVAASYPIKEYRPKEEQSWQKAYLRYLKLCGQERN